VNISGIDFSMRILEIRERLIKAQIW